MEKPKLFPLRDIDAFGSEDIQDAIDMAPELFSFREAVGTIIQAIHGLPEALDCELRQIEVYLGRAGGAADLLKGRWKVRLKSFGSAPSTHAMAVFRSSTARLRKGGWERAAHRVIGALERNNALCCANAVAGSNGPWPATRQTTIYLVARTKPGRIGEITEASVNRAIRELMDERDIDSDALVEAGRLIPDRHTMLDLEIAELPDLDLESESNAPACRESDCKYPARPGNFGFCGYHRRVSSEQKCREPGCRFAPHPRNYGFCRRHR
jgi:hypothetical protein